MKSSALFGGLLVASLGFNLFLFLNKGPGHDTACTSCATTDVKIMSKNQRISTALGEEVGKQVTRTLGEDLDFGTFTAAIKRAIDGKENLLKEDEKQTAMKDFQETVQNKMKAKADANKKTGEDFLTENKKKSDVKTTESGLQYKVLKKGTGEVPKNDSEVSVHYEGRLIDGTVFDSSFKRNEPANFRVTQVIPGWTEALKLMTEGSEWEVYIPAHLAYGERELPTIPANSTLVFKVNLLSIKKPEPKKEPAKKAEAKKKTSEKSATK